MHDPNWSKLEQAIDRMSESEKRDLIHKLERSLDRNGRPVSPTAETQEGAVAQQKRAWAELRTRAAAAPTREPDDGVVASRDHDKILYDGTGRSSFPEKPRL